MREWVAEEESTLKDFTDEHDPQASFYFTRLLKNREIKVNGKRAERDMPISAGDIIRYYLTKEQEEKPAFYTVYEDENILLADKESGVNSEAVYAMLLRSAEEKGEKIYFIHRLDRNTRGLILFAKNERAEVETKKAFKERTFEKVYLAVCADRFAKDASVEEAYLKKDEKRALVCVSEKAQKGAEKIVTEYRVLQRKGDLALAEITLHTGKTHQIRAHLAFLGCPVLGDTKYGEKALNERYNKTRQCLVAKRLTLHFTESSPLRYADGKTFVSRFSLSPDDF